MRHVLIADFSSDTVPLERVLANYCRERGWNEQTDIPENETIERLGLTDLIRSHTQETIPLSERVESQSAINPAVSVLS